MVVVRQASRRVWVMHLAVAAGGREVVGLGVLFLLLRPGQMQGDRGDDGSDGGDQAGAEEAPENPSVRAVGLAIWVAPREAATAVIAARPRAEPSW
jgi:hypothetical protein